MRPSRTSAAAAAIAAAILSLAAAGAGSPPGRDEDILYRELLAHIDHWDSEVVGRFSRVIASLPEEVACEALWIAAGVPERLNVLSIYSAALKSPSSLVRRQTFDILVARGGQDEIRLVLGMLAANDELNPHIIGAIAKKSANKSIPILIDILFYPNIPPDSRALTVERLRSITSADIRDDAMGWRNWWDDNERFYR